MANCQNNMRYGRQGNMYMQRPSWNMQRNTSRMEAERRAEEARRNVNSDTCGCRAGQREERREDRSGCGCREEHRGERTGCGCKEEHREERREERTGCGCREVRREECREEKSGCGCGEDQHRNRKEEERGCGCGREDRLFGLPLAMAYVPWQRWNSIYDVCEALQRGTIFEELDKPFLGRGGCNR